MVEPSTVTTIALASLGVASTVGVWAIRQEGRLNAHDQLFVEREKLANERHEDLKADLQEIKRLIKKS